MLPQLFYTQYVVKQSKLIYAFYWLPNVPAMDLIVQTLNPRDEYVVNSIFSNMFINHYFSWAALLVGIVFWFFLYIYLDSILPSEYGITRHPLFCLRKKQAVVDDVYSPRADIESSHLGAEDPIKLMQLTKKFGAFKAVDSLTFSIREGEVFTMLGHNGAGKTTAIFMLTGVHNPTSGDAYVYGSSLKNDIASVQRKLGLCQ